MGTRDGLLHLRSQIDEALEKGSVEISKDVDFDFAKISVQDVHPRDVVKPAKSSDRYLKYGCLGTLVVLLYLIGVGAYHVIKALVQ